jgi:hypothetical protein
LLNKIIVVCCLQERLKKGFTKRQSPIISSGF